MEVFAAGGGKGDLRVVESIGVGGQAFDPHPHLGGVIGLVGDVDAVVVYLITLIDLCAIDREVIGLVAHDTQVSMPIPSNNTGRTHDARCSTLERFLRSAAAPDCVFRGPSLYCSRPFSPCFS